MLPGRYEFSWSRLTLACFHLRFKEKAVRTVRTHCLLIKEEVNSSSMSAAFQKTAISEWKGETLQTMSEHLGFQLRLDQATCMLHTTDNQD